MPQNKIWRDQIFLLTLLMAAFFLSITLWFKFTMDQSLCNYSAWVWKTYHEPPYVGVWDLSFPGIFVLHRAVIAVFGRSFFGFRLFDALVQLGSVAMIYALARRLSGKRAAGFLAGVFYSIYYADLGSLETGEREGFILSLMLLSMVLGLRLKDRVWMRATLAGLLLGFAFLLKPTYGLCWLVFGVWFLSEGIRSRPRTVWVEMLVYAFFCLLPSGLVVLYYFHLGHLKDLYQATIIFNQEIYSRSASANYAGMSSLELMLRVVYRDYLQESLIMFAGFLMILFHLAGREAARDRKLFRVLAGLIGVSWFSYWFQAKYFPYHLTPFIGLMTIPAGGFMAWIADRLKGEGDSFRALIPSRIFYLFLLVVMFPGIHSTLAGYLQHDYFRSFDQVYSSGNSYDARYYQAAKELEPLLRNQKEIEYFGWHPILPYMLGKKLPSRFCVVYHLLMRRQDGRLSALQEQWIREYTEDVIKARPRFFLVADQVPGWDVFNLQSPSLKQALHERFPELEAFLKEHYFLYEKNSLLEIYVRSGG